MGGLAPPAGAVPISPAATLPPPPPGAEPIAAGGYSTPPVPAPPPPGATLTLPAPPAGAVPISTPAPSRTAAPSGPLPVVSDLITKYSSGNFALDRLGRIVSGIESTGGRNAVVSSAGARGIMQIMPDTAKQYGFDPKRLDEPEYNVHVGMTILADLLKRAGGDPVKAAIGYNAGPGRMNDPIHTLAEETRKYVDKLRAGLALPTMAPAPPHPATPAAPRPLSPPLPPGAVAPGGMAAALAAGNPMDAPGSSSLPTPTLGEIAHSGLSTLAGHQDLLAIMLNAAARDNGGDAFERAMRGEKGVVYKGITTLARDPKSNVARAWALYLKDPVKAMDEFGLGSAAQAKYMAEKFPNTATGRAAKTEIEHPKTTAAITFLGELFNPVAIAEGGAAGTVLGRIARVGKVADTGQALAKGLGVGSPLYDLAKRGGPEASQWAKGLIASVKAEDKHADERMMKIFGGLSQHEQWEVVRISQGLKPDAQFFGKYVDLAKRAKFLRDDVKHMTAVQESRGLLDAAKGDVFDRETYFPMSRTHDFGPQFELEQELRGAGPAGGSTTQSKVFKNVDESRREKTWDPTASAAENYMNWRRQRGQKIAFEDALQRAPESLRRDIRPSDYKYTGAANAAPAAAPKEYDLFRFQQTQGEAEYSPGRTATFYAVGKPAEGGTSGIIMPNKYQAKAGREPTVGGAHMVTEKYAPRNLLELPPKRGSVGLEVISRFYGPERAAAISRSAKRIAAGEYLSTEDADALAKELGLHPTDRPPMAFTPGSKEPNTAWEDALFSDQSASAIVDRLGVEVARQKGYDAVLMRGGEKGGTDQFVRLYKRGESPGEKRMAARESQRAPAAGGDLKQPFVRSATQTPHEAMEQVVAENNAHFPEGHPQRITLKEQTEYVAAKRVLQNEKSPTLARSMIAPELWKFFQRNGQFARYVDQGGTFLPGEENTWMGKLVHLTRSAIFANFLYHPAINVAGNDAVARGLYGLGGAQYERAGYTVNAAKSLALQAGLVKPEQFVGGAQQYATWLDRAMKNGALAEFGVSRKTMLGGDRARLMTEPIEDKMWTEYESRQATWVKRFDKALTKAMDENVVRTFGDKGEEAFAVSLFKDAIEKGKMSDAQAGQMVREALGDYYNLDPKSPWSAAFLFMPWLKGNTKFWIQTLVRKPQYATAQAEATQQYNIGQGDPAYEGRYPPPDLRIFLGNDSQGAPRYFTPPFVGRDIAKIANAGISAAKGDVNEPVYEGLSFFGGRANPFSRAVMDTLTTAAYAATTDLKGPESDFHAIYNPKAPNDVKAKQIGAYFASHFIPVPLFEYAFQDAARKGMSPEDLTKALLNAAGVGMMSESIPQDMRRDMSRAKRAYLKAYAKSLDPDASPEERDLHADWDAYIEELRAAGAVH